MAKKPFIYFSAGVGNAQFVESLNMAAEAGTDYSGVLCGRATWKDGVPVYAKQGVKALEDWLSDQGVKNINAVNDAIKSAKPWHAKAGVAADGLIAARFCMTFASIPEAIEDFRQGKILIVVDDEDRENEGDLTIAATKISPEAINFMATRGRGLICLALDAEICNRLDLQPMSPVNTARFGTAFCEAIDAAEGATTGISAYDRAHTIRSRWMRGPGPRIWRGRDMFSHCVRVPGGVLVRSGQTEAAVDLARLAGLPPGGVICEIMNEDGTMARVPQLQEFCRQYGLKMISVADLIRYRLQTEKFVQREAAGRIQTAVWRISNDPIYEPARQRKPSGVGAWRYRRKKKRAGARAFTLLVRRCIPFERLRLPRFDCSSSRDDFARRLRRSVLSAPDWPRTARGVARWPSRAGRARPKPIELYPVGTPSTAAARNRRRRADPVRSRPNHDSSVNESPAQSGRTGRLRHSDHRTNSLPQRERE